MALSHTWNFKFDTIQYTDALNWKETQIQLNREEDTDGIVWRVSGEFVFNKKNGAWPIPLISNGISAGAKQR